MKNKKIKIAILGSSGRLGQDITRVFDNKKFIIKKILSSNCNYLDKPNNLFKILNKFKADFLINCAGLARLKDCEKNSKLAYDLNAFLPYNLSLFCKKLNTVLIHISTEAVFFGGKKTSYTVKDIPFPKSIYGKSKFSGEKLIIDYKKALVLRLPIFYGRYDKKFMRLINKIKKNQKIYVAKDIYSTPVNTLDVARYIRLIIEKRKIQRLLKKRILHLSSNKRISYFDLIYKISKKIDKNNFVHPVKNSYFDKDGIKPKKIGLISNVNDFKIYSEKW